MSLLRKKNWKKKDVTEKCIRDFAESTKYFINGGFQK